MNYQQVDPATIIFDFNRTKIKTPTPEESTWIQLAAFVNGHSWRIVGKSAQFANRAYLYLEENGHLVSGADGHTFQKDANREITIQDILDAQLIKNQIEVGDAVEIVNRANYDKSLVVGDRGVVTQIDTNSETSYIYADFGVVKGQIGRQDQLKLVLKAPKQEIIGYELLQDLPGILAGSKHGIHSGQIWINHMIFKEEQLQDTKFFKPIYKPKEKVVKVSGRRQVTITPTTIVLPGQGEVTHADAEYIHTLLQNNESTTTALTISVESIRIGCQTFTREDLNKIYQTLKAQ